jgi:hypothetical protein
MCDAALGVAAPLAAARPVATDRAAQPEPPVPGCQPEPDVGWCGVIAMRRFDRVPFTLCVIDSVRIGTSAFYFGRYRPAQFIEIAVG